MVSAAALKRDCIRDWAALQRIGMRNWTLRDIAWDRFDPKTVNVELLAVVKTASLVERNSADYASYLRNVFKDDPLFQQAVAEWAREERQHGEALGRWAEMADPTFNFSDCFQAFVTGYRIALDSSRSIRGSRAGELIARCVIESGTSSYYSALRDGTQEPVLKEICHRIAGDEFRHYKLFFSYLQAYLRVDKLDTKNRLRIICERFLEIGDDELSFAYHCANNMDEPYNRRRANALYTHRASLYYSRRHVERAVGMMLKAAGVSPQGWISRLAAQAAWLHVRHRQRRRPADAPQKACAAVA